MAERKTQLQTYRFPSHLLSLEVWLARVLLDQLFLKALDHNPLYHEALEQTSRNVHFGRELYTYINSDSFPFILESIGQCDIHTIKKSFLKVH